MEAEPSFDDWVKLVFDHPVREPEWYWEVDHEWSELPAKTGVAFLTELFARSREILRYYSDEQVDQGLWFLIGPASDTAQSLLDRDVPEAERLECLNATVNLFRLFAEQCSANLSHLDVFGAKPVNSICYMFWDLFPTWGHPEEPGWGPFDRAVLTVQSEILQIPSDPCRESALHGLNHWQPQYPDAVAQVIARFLDEHRDLRTELRSYAERAMTGGVL